MHVNYQIEENVSYARASSRFASSPKNWCTWLKAIEPSPTAEATRFTEPLRTSPMAKKLGMLVSKDCGLLFL